MTPIRRLIAKKVALAHTMRAKFDVHRGYATRIFVTHGGGWFGWDGFSKKDLQVAYSHLLNTPDARAVLWITHPKVSHSDALPHEDVTALIKEIM